MIAYIAFSIPHSEFRNPHLALSISLFLCLPLSPFFFPMLPFAPEAYPKGQKDQPQVQPEGLFPDIKEVVAKLLPWRNVFGFVNRRHPGQARADAQSLPEVRDLFIIQPASLLIVKDLADGQSPGSDQAHLPPEDADHLGELVQPHGPKDAAHARNPRVVLRRLLDSEDPVGVGHHRAKFIGLETGPSPAPALLPVKDRTPVFELDGQGNEQGDGSREDEHQAGEGHIQGSLQPGFPGFRNKDSLDFSGSSGHAS